MYWGRICCRRLRPGTFLCSVYVCVQDMIFRERANMVQFHNWQEQLSGIHCQGALALAYYRSPAGMKLSAHDATFSCTAGATWAAGRCHLYVEPYQQKSEKTFQEGKLCDNYQGMSWLSYSDTISASIIPLMSISIDKDCCGEIYVKNGCRIPDGRWKNQALWGLAVAIVAYGQSGMPPRWHTRQSLWALFRHHTCRLLA